MPNLFIVGAGMGNIEFLTQKAYSIIKNSSNVISTERISKGLLDINKNIKILKINGIIPYLNENVSDSVLIVSGDTGFFSFSSNIVNNLSNIYKITSINGLNSMQYLASILNSDYSKWVCLSLHGRKNYELLGAVSYNQYIFILTGGEYTINKICNILISHGLSNADIVIGENLSYKNERIIYGKVKDIADLEFESLCVILIENKEYSNPFLYLKDSDFIREKIPMTKEEIRKISIEKLKIKPDSIIYDIGAGTGSITIEAARKASRGMVYSIEYKKEACELIKKNIIKHKAFNTEIINSSAPLNQKYTSLPIPDSVFIGGSNGNLKAILEWILNKNTDIHVVINCITLETLTEALQLLKSFHFKNVDVICVNISKAKNIGNYNLMTADNPVYIISADGVENEFEKKYK